MSTQGPPPLDVNVCRHCHLLIQLVPNVGWLHIPNLLGPDTPDADEMQPCEKVEPSLLRCWVCRGVGPSGPTGRMLVHQHPTGRKCVGSNVVGQPPASESAAFDL